jgi:catechol-2,3-dioxygenase
VAGAAYSFGQRTNWGIWMFRVCRLAYASFETPDVGRLVDYYTNILGLCLVERIGGTAYLASTLDHHSIVLRPGMRPRCIGVAFQTVPGSDLGELQHHLQTLGIRSAHQPEPEPAIRECIEFEDPNGIAIRVFAECEFSQQEFQSKGIVPLKLGHISFNAMGSAAVANFYCKALGFRVSDAIEDFFIFLRCGPDHHTINFIDSQHAKMNHIAFELRDRYHIVSSSDFLAQNGYKLIWGPGRHARGHNIFTYHRNPDQQIVELFAEMDRISNEELGYFEPRPWHADRPHKPKVWPRDPAATNLWGIMAPAGFLD